MCGSCGGKKAGPSPCGVGFGVLYLFQLHGALPLSGYIAAFSSLFPLGKLPFHVCPTHHNADMECFSLSVNPTEEGEAYDRVPLCSHVCDHPVCGAGAPGRFEPDACAAADHD